MAAAIQTNLASERDRKQRLIDRKFVEYKLTSLERNFNHEIITPHDLGVAIDVIDPETTYAVDPNAVLHPDDEKLLEDDDFPVLQDSKRVQLSKRHPKAGMHQACSRLLIRHRSLNEKELLQQSASKDGYGKESIDEDGVMKEANAEEMKEEDAEDKSNANSSISCVPSLSENEEEEEEKDQKEWDDKDLFGSSDSE